MSLRPAAEILLLEAAAIEPILRSTAQSDFDLPTVCDGWAVRDVMAHCAAALTRTASGDLHSFSPADNQTDVDLRRGWLVADVLDELVAGYESAATAIDGAAGVLDGIGLGEWMHGGDIRHALGRANAYTSEGIELALDLLIVRSASAGKPSVSVFLPDRTLAYGVGEPAGTLRTDAETFVRICGGRRPDPSRYEVGGEFDKDDLILFS